MPQVMNEGRCADCSEAMKGDAVVALNRLWHPEHFKCSECVKQILESFIPKDEKPFCESCFVQKFNPKCAGCDSIVTDEYVSALGSSWHKQCFVCAACGTPLDEEFFLVDGEPHDLDCHWAKRLQQHRQLQ